MLVAAAVRFVDNGSSAARDGLARAFLSDPRVGNIVRTLALTKGLGLDEAEEIRQQAAIALIAVADRGGITKPRGAYSLAYAITERVALGAASALANARMTISLDDHDKEEGRPLIEDLHDSWNEAELSESIDAEKSRATIREVLYKHRNLNTRGAQVMDQPSASNVVGLPVDFGGRQSRSAPRPRPVAARKKTTLKPRAEELKSIREKLEITNDEFGAALDIGAPRLASYLYGRTEPGEEVLEKARELLKDSTRQIAEIERLFKRPAQEIVQSWIEMIGAKDKPQDEGFDDLAAILGINVVTVRRWWDGKVGLKPMRAVQYHRRLVRELKRQTA